jgi:hypothetical protein
MTASPTDGVCASSALAFSTLLSSQGAGAHLRRTLTRLQGNRCNLPGSEPLVNPVPRGTLLAFGTLPCLQGSASHDLRTRRKPSLEGLPGGSPVTWPLSRPSPRGKKNFREAWRLRQIKPSNSRYRSSGEMRRGGDRLGLPHQVLLCALQHAELPDSSRPSAKAAGPGPAQAPPPAAPSSGFCV